MIHAAEGMHVEWVEDEAVVLDQESGQLHYLNAPSALILALILEHGYDEAMIELERLRVDAASIKDDVRQAVSQMIEKGLLLDD